MRSVVTLNNYTGEDLILNAPGSELEIIFSGINYISGIVSTITNITIHGVDDGSNLFVANSGALTLDTLNLETANVSFQSEVNVGTLANEDGSSSVTLSGGSTIGDIDTAGVLTLFTNEYYENYVDNRDDSNDSATTITGHIGGGGELCLNSGVYDIAARRDFVKTRDLNGNGRSCRFHPLAAVVHHCADTSY